MKNCLLLLWIIFFVQCKESTRISVDGQESSEMVDPVQLGEVQQISIADAKIMMADKPELVVIDVRTPEEHAEGALPGAINIDVKNDSFGYFIRTLDPNVEYLVHCKSGSRSEKATTIMHDKGFKKLYNLEGGYLAWLDSLSK